MITKITQITKKGFTLLEMLVVLSISTILVGVVIFNYRDADSSLIMRNLAFEVSLTIRQAQTYGLGVRDSQDENNAFDIAYGVQFLGPVDGVANDTFFLFADTNNTGTSQLRKCNQSVSGDPCTNLNGEEVLDSLSLTRQITFDRISGNPSSGTGEVELSQGEPLNITFKRPNPDATINLDGEDMNDVTLTLMGPNGSKIDVYVNTAGQISVQEHVE
jgi:prepilin-type N-terminal cleavage/methylation domain-containing protein